MGGSSSKTTISDTANLLSNSIMNSAANCITSDNQSNNLNVSGNNNVVNNVSQKASFTFSSDCTTKSSSVSSILQTLNNSTAASQVAEQQALAGFLDESSQSISDKIANNVIDTVTISNITTCADAVNSNNGLNVNGNNNVINNVKQTSDIDLLESCIVDAAQQSNSATDITNSSNMNQQYKSDSLFEPFTAAFQTIMEAGILGIVFVIILVTCIVIAYKYVKLNKQPKSVYNAPNGSTVL